MGDGKEEAWRKKNANSRQREKGWVVSGPWVGQAGKFRWRKKEGDWGVGGCRT